MELTEAIKILRSLASGENPETGERFSSESVFEEPKVIRALYRAIEELESRERTELKRRQTEERRRKKEERRQNPKWPRNAGKPWDREAEARLVTLWEQGAMVDQIAEEMERGSGGIWSRLVRLGLVPDRDTARARGTAPPGTGDIPPGEDQG